jgi:transposase-like protein
MGFSPAMPASLCCRPRPGPNWVPFSKPNVAANSHLLTDGFASYRGRDADLAEHFKHTPVIQDASANAGEFFPIIHTLFSNLKAWLVGTHHGVSARHLPRYLREWSYRFNCGNLPDGLDRYLIRRAVECAIITYDQLKAGPCWPVPPASAAFPWATCFSLIGIISD